MTLKQLAKEAEAAVLKAQMREEWEAQMREDAFGSRQARNAYAGFLYKLIQSKELVANKIGTKL